MRLTSEVSLIGGGTFGFGLSAPLDCHVYLLDGGDELAIVDAGVGGICGDTERILENITANGHDLTKINKLLLTHYHGDHAGGAAEIQRRLGIEVHASPIAASALAAGDEHATGLDVAKQVGFYPSDYVLQPVSAMPDLVEGATFAVGSLQVTVFETPGHCDGHISLLVKGSDRRYLVQGDVIFAGGTILLQNIHDCSIQKYAASAAKLATLDFDAFLPGHLSISLTDGKRHVEAAAAAFAQLMVPKNCV